MSQTSTVDRVPERGTFCVVIQQQIVISTCPLPKGGCYWKHRVHGRCCYDENFANSKFTVNAFAQRVGLPPLDPPLEAVIKRSVVDKLQRELRNDQ